MKWVYCLNIMRLMVYLMLVWCHVYITRTNVLGIKTIQSLFFLFLNQTKIWREIRHRLRNKILLVLIYLLWVKQICVFGWIYWLWYIIWIIDLVIIHSICDWLFINLFVFLMMIFWIIILTVWIVDLGGLMIIKNVRIIEIVIVLLK